MTDWLLNNNAPEWATLLEDCKLKDFTADNEITIKRQDLDNEEILNLIEHGNSVISLAIQRENHLSFVLNQDGTLGKIKFEDDITERNDDILKEDYQQRFDADFILMAEELSQLFELLTAEFDGITSQRLRHRAAAQRLRHRATTQRLRHRAAAQRLRHRATSQRLRHRAAAQRLRHRATSQRRLRQEIIP